MIDSTNQSPQSPNPSREDVALAQTSLEQLSRFLATEAKHSSVEIQIEAENCGEATIAIPLAAMKILSQALAEMSQGNAVALFPMQAELTTQQAAELLSVSRPFLVEQLEEGKIPFRKVGTHRRIRLPDLLRYKQLMDQSRLKTLEELAEQAQELNLGY